MTYQEIAQEIGVSHQAIWEIEKRIITKLQKRLMDEGYTIEDFRGFNFWEILND